MVKKLILIAILIFIVQNWGHIRDFLYPPPDYSAAHSEKVILYATAWCGYCDKTRELLKANNINYFEYDIEKSEEGYRQHQRLGGGGIPVLLIDGQVVRGYTPSTILELAK
jgi:glutaredoxin